MGQGQDKVAKNLVDLQPTAIVELFLLYFDTIDNENAFIGFHGGSIFADTITWQNIEYLPLPVETDGFEISANGELSRPKIKISNKDYFITDILNRYQDLQFAKITRKRTFVKFLDDINFDGGNPWGEADSSAEISNDTYLIGQKTAENKLFVELELTSPLDLDNFEVNNRIILARYCSWYYRGAGCNYNGPPIETEEGDEIFLNQEIINEWPTISIDNEWESNRLYQSGDVAYLYNQKNNSNTNSNTNFKIWYFCKETHASTNLLRPDLNLKYWVKDGCAKKLYNCKKRFDNENNTSNIITPATLTTNYFDLTYRTFNDIQNSNVFLSLNNATEVYSAPSLHIATWFKLNSTPFPGENVVYTPLFGIQALELPDAQWHFGDSNGLYLEAYRDLTLNTIEIVAYVTIATTVNIGSAGRPNYVEKFTDKTITLTTAATQDLIAVHCEVFGGRANGLDVEDAEPGYLKLSTNGNSIVYTLPSQRPRVGDDGFIYNTSIPYEMKKTYFRFRNPTTQLIGSNIHFFDGEGNSTLSTTAIWTGDNEVPTVRKELFNRNDQSSKFYNSLIANKKPLKYSEAKTSLKNNLFGWWDMDITNSAPRQILNSHLGGQSLNLSGNYDAKMERSDSVDFYELISRNQETSLPLPFGGFPGTDNYER
jgi:lambda family phage minor tail protein L